MKDTQHRSIALQTCLRTYGPIFAEFLAIEIWEKQLIKGFNPQITQITWIISSL
jgi:hypothetical protein